MKRFLLVAISLVLVLGCSKKPVDRPIGIIPQPAFLQQEEGVFTLEKTTPVYVDAGDSSLLRTIGFLNERLEKAAGFSLKVIQDDPLRHGQEKGIFLLDAELSKEAYNLEITPGRVLIEYGDGAGAFYAVQTILQLLPTEIFAESRICLFRNLIPYFLRTAVIQRILFIRKAVQGVDE